MGRRGYIVNQDFKWFHVSNVAEVLSFQVQNRCLKIMFILCYITVFYSLLSFVFLSFLFMSVHSNGNHFSIRFVSLVCFPLEHRAMRAPAAIFCCTHVIALLFVSWLALAKLVKMGYACNTCFGCCQVKPNQLQLLNILLENLLWMLLGQMLYIISQNLLSELVSSDFFLSRSASDRLRKV